MTKVISSSSKKTLLNYILFSIFVILLFNLYIYQGNKSDFTKNQLKTAQSIITALNAKIELPLLVADNDSIQIELNKITSDKDIVNIKIYDNKGSLVAEKRNSSESLIQKSNNILEEKIYNRPKSSEYEDIFSDTNDVNDGRHIGEIHVEMANYQAAKQLLSNPLAYSYNIILLLFLIAVGIFIFIRAKKEQQQLSLLSKFLRSNNDFYLSADKFDQFPSLFNSASYAVDKIAKQNLQLVNLKQEISYAREDSNLELNHFLDFLIQSEKVHFDNDLITFVNAVLESKSEELDLIDISKSIRLTIAQHSELMQQHGVMIYDNTLGELEEYNVCIDKTLFLKFLTLFLQQLILLCQKSTIKIQSDINKIHNDSHLLRISFESSSPAFKHALEQQKLFDFSPHSEISIDTNNASFIACKHLLHKAGGDYIFLKNEVRFEFPVVIEKSFVSTSNLSKISPLEIKRSLLVFDSDPTERIVLMGYLEKLGQKLDKATTKQVVLQKLRRNQFDILCVNSDFFSDEDPYFLTKFESEYLSMEKPPLLSVISSNNEIVENNYFKAFKAKLLSKPIDLKTLTLLLEKLS